MPKFASTDKLIVVGGTAQILPMRGPSLGRWLNSFKSVINKFWYYIVLWYLRLCPLWHYAWIKPAGASPRLQLINSLLLHALSWKSFFSVFHVWFMGWIEVPNCLLNKNYLNYLVGLLWVSRVLVYPWSNIKLIT